MKKVILSEIAENISVRSLVNMLTYEEDITVVYKARSDHPYYSFLTKVGNKFGFMGHLSLEPRITYEANSAEASIKAAIKGGKELFTFDRTEQYQIFNFI